MLTLVQNAISIEICASGDCVLYPSSGEIVICTNTANSCSIHCDNDDCWGSTMYLAASSHNYVYCDGDKSCHTSLIYCGIPLSYPDGYNINNFNGHINECKFYFTNKASPGDSTVRCYSDIDSCYLRSYTGYSNFMNSAFFCELSPLNSNCEMQCDSTQACDNSDYHCSASTCDCTGTGCGVVSIFTPNPTKPPTVNPTVSPSTLQPSMPTFNPSFDPSMGPTSNPTIIPTFEPTVYPSMSTFNPTIYPTFEPTIYPSYNPTIDPTTYPSYNPTIKPTIYPSSNPTNELTMIPTKRPTHPPTTSIQTIYNTNISIVYSTTENELITDQNTTTNFRITVKTIIILTISSFVIISTLLWLYCIMFYLSNKAKRRKISQKLEMIDMVDINHKMKVISLSISRISPTQTSELTSPKSMLTDINSNESKDFGETSEESDNSSLSSSSENENMSSAGVASSDCATTSNDKSKLKYDDELNIFHQYVVQSTKNRLYVNNTLNNTGTYKKSMEEYFRSPPQHYPSEITLPGIPQASMS